MIAAPLRQRALLICALVFLPGLAPSHADTPALPALLHAEHPLVGRIWDMRANRAVDEPALIERLKSAEAVLLGETHDNPEHHRLQQKLLNARLATGEKPALVMEQFDTERQPAIDRARQAGEDADALARSAEIAKGWDWAAYRPLVARALQDGLPVIAANFSRERMRAVIREGFATFDAAELARLQVEAAWSAGRDQYLAGVIEASHCGQIDARMKEGLVRGQRLRDAVMADAMLPALDRGVVAILGRGHIRRDVGAPRYLEIRRPGTRTLAIAFVEVSPEKATPEAYESERAEGVAPYDFLWFTARADRPDPCANFPKRG